MNRDWDCMEVQCQLLGALWFAASLPLISPLSFTASSLPFHPLHPPLIDSQIGRNWRPLQRSMSRADPEREGALPTKVFFDILQSNGIQLSPRQQIQVQEVLDPGLTDTINYHEFFKAFLG